MQLEARVTKNMLQTNVPLSKPASLCVVSDDLLLCTDDGHRYSHLESTAKSDSSVVYFAATKSPHCNGCLYCFDLESSEVANVLENMTTAERSRK